MPVPSLITYVSRGVFSVREDHPLAEVAGLMGERQVRHVPVIGGEGELAGILSDRDLKLASDPGGGGIKPGVLVRDFMSAPVITIDSEASVTEAVNLLLEWKISCVAVTQGNSLWGILTTDDLLRLLRDLVEKEGSPKRRLRVLDYLYKPVTQEALREAGSVGI